MYTIRRTDDKELFERLFKQVLPSDALPRATERWIARDADGAPVGFASAFCDSAGNVFLSSAGVLPRARGAGLQRRLIRVRVNWARSIGAPKVYTYTVLKNYPSMISLIKAGFELYTPYYAYAGADAHYFLLNIR